MKKHSTAAARAAKNAEQTDLRRKEGLRPMQILGESNVVRMQKVGKSRRKLVELTERLMKQRIGMTIRIDNKPHWQWMYQMSGVNDIVVATTES